MTAYKASAAPMSVSLDFLLLSTVSLFSIVNPFSTVPAFLAITPGDSLEERRRAARLACIVSACLLACMAMLGEFIFRLLGITLPALQIAGGVILFTIGFEMVRAPDAPVRLNEKEKAIAREKEDIAITPLAMPLLCGPGAISTVIILQGEAQTIMDSGLLLLSVAAVYISAYFILVASASSGAWLNPILLRILRRVMGLLFAVIAVQFIVNGISSLPFVPGGIETLPDG